MPSRRSGTRSPSRRRRSSRGQEEKNNRRDRSRDRSRENKRDKKTKRSRTRSKSRDDSKRNGRESKTDQPPPHEDVSETQIVADSLRDFNGDTFELYRHAGEADKKLMQRKEFADSRNRTTYSKSRLTSMDVKPRRRRRASDDYQDTLVSRKWEAWNLTVGPVSTTSARKVKVAEPEDSSTNTHRDRDRPAVKGSMQSDRRLESKVGAHSRLGKRSRAGADQEEAVDVRPQSKVTCVMQRLGNQPDRSGRSQMQETTQFGIHGAARFNGRMEHRQFDSYGGGGRMGGRVGMPNTGRLGTVVYRPEDNNKPQLVLEDPRKVPRGFSYFDHDDREADSRPGRRSFGAGDRFGRGHGFGNQSFGRRESYGGSGRRRTNDGFGGDVWQHDMFQTLTDETQDKDTTQADAPMDNVPVDTDIVIDNEPVVLPVPDEQVV